MTTATPIEDGEIIEAPGCYAMSLDHYHGNCCAGPSISSTGLRTIADPTQGPAAYWTTSPLNPHRIERETKSYLALGHAAHTLILGEQGFAEQYSVRPAEFRDWRTKAAQEWRDAEIAAGRTVLTPDDIETIRGMAGLLPWQQPSSGWSVPESGLSNSRYVKLGLLEGEIERSLIYRDAETGVWVKSRPDVLPTASRIVADLKTTTSQAPDRAIWEYGYHAQGAVVRSAMKAVLDAEMEEFFLVFVQAVPPYRVTIREIARVDLDAGAIQNRQALDVFARCLEAREWPAGDGEPRKAKMPAWYEARLNNTNGSMENAA